MFALKLNGGQCYKEIANFGSLKMLEKIKLYLEKI